MKQLNTVIKFLFALSAITFFFACSGKPITIKSITGVTEVALGDTARLEWNIENADRVNFDGIDHDFLPHDSYLVVPNYNTNYKIVAHNRYNDSLEIYMIISVKEKEQKVKRAPMGYEPVELSPSVTESEYLNGIIGNPNKNQPAYLKIMGLAKSANDNNYFIKFLVLDRFGNFIQNVFNNNDRYSLNVSTTCESTQTDRSVSSVSENDNLTSKNIDLGIMLDNSASANLNPDILFQIKSFLPSLSLKDEVLLSYFNQNYYQAVSLTTSDNFYSKMEDMTFPPPQGLNAIYKSSFKLIDNLNNGNNSTKAVVIFTYLADNASIVYTSLDLAQKAIANNIPVYIIGIGNAVDSYTLRYLTSLTGGRFYSLQKEDIGKLQSVLMEIVFAQKYYYEFNLPLKSNCQSERIVNVKLNLKDNNKNSVYDNYDAVVKPETQYMLYQALATFDYRDTTIAEEFFDNLISLSKILQDKNNSGQVIELIGNSSIEGDANLNMELSLKRVQNVRKFLIAHGTPPAQIRVRAEGSNKPIYYLQSAPWQQLVNRRVEMRWLDPSILPYEIIAESVQSEEEAMKKVETWESKNLRAYYDRYLQDNQPVYRVKLWGYARIEEAQDAAKTLEKKYKLVLKVE